MGGVIMNTDRQMYIPTHITSLVKVFIMTVDKKQWGNFQKFNNITEMKET